MIRLLLSAAAFALAAGAAPVAAQTAPATATAPAVQMEHISIVAIGKGPDVYLIPGLSSPRAVYDGVAADLAKTHRVHLVQINGFDGGDPRANLKPGIIDGVIADLIRYGTDRRIGRPAVVGHSLGGLIGIAIAARHPQAVGRLMVVDALPFIGAIFNVPDAAAARPQAEAMRAQMLASADAARARAATTVTSDPGGIWSNTPAGRIQVANWSMKADQRVVAQAMYEDMTLDLRGELGNIAAKPFTVLYATGAGPQATALWEREYKGSPATLVPVADSWHFIMLDQPAEFAKQLKTFLNEK